MGWADCGGDSRGRRIGYGVSATCDHPGCKEKIDRGLGYACGGMHGDEYGCEGYFCGDHMRYSERAETWSGRGGFVCFACSGTKVVRR